MEHNLGTIKEVLQKHIKIMNGDSELSNTEKIDTLKYGCSIAIADIMRNEGTDDDKNLICNKINEILEKQILAWSN